MTLQYSTHDCIQPALKYLWGRRPLASLGSLCRSHKAFPHLCLSPGFKTCVFTNNWVDDSAGRLFTSSLLTVLQRHFDLVIESCRVGLHKPDPRIYTYTLELLQAQPQEVWGHHRSLQLPRCWW